ncbi:MAG: hypothetical protein Q7R95_10600 [bacterium]|nr:hypothetical protein [bacterium]
MTEIQRIINDTRQKDIGAIRAACIVCNGHGSHEQNGELIECEYCGRPIDAIRALIKKEIQCESVVREYFEGEWIPLAPN